MYSSVFADMYGGTTVQYSLLFVITTSSFITVQEVPKRVKQGCPTFLWQPATPVTVGGFTGC